MSERVGVAVCGSIALSLLGAGAGVAQDGHGSIIGWGSRVVGVALGHDLVPVDGGADHSLGLKLDGSIAAWGDDYWGQCNAPRPDALTENSASRWGSGAHGCTPSPEIQGDTWDYGFKFWHDEAESAALDNPLPSPANLRITLFYSTAHLEWDLVNDLNLAGYEVYRRTATGTYGPPIKRVLRTSFTDYKLTPGQQYYYKLRAINGSGQPVSQFTPEQPATMGTDPSLYSRHKNFELLMVFYKGGYTPTRVSQLTEGLKRGLTFYWRTSAGRLNMDVTWLYIDGPAPGGNWYNSALQADLYARGVQDHQFDLGYLVATNLDGCLGGYVVFGSMCASLGTVCGVPYPGKDPNVDYTIAWTFTHEIHHALEVMEDLTPGTPEVLFCHFPWCYPDPLGSTGWHMDWGAHYDGIGLTNREYGDNWMLYPAPYDGYIECVDADGDDLPDNDSRVWMDEARFGSLATSPDTDADGLDDLAGRHDSWRRHRVDVPRCHRLAGTKDLRRRHVRQLHLHRGRQAKNAHLGAQRRPESARHHLLVLRREPGRAQDRRAQAGRLLRRHDARRFVHVHPARPAADR